MGAALASLFVRESNSLGSRSSTWHSGVGWFLIHGLAHLQGRVASCAPLGLDRDLFLLAIAPVQPNNALSIAHLSIDGDDGGVVCV